MSMVTITAPAAGSTVVVGTTFTVSGSTESIEETKYGEVVNEVWPDSVTFSVDSGAEQLATNLDENWSSWEAAVRLTTPGSHTVTAFALYYGRDTYEATLTVEAVAAPLTLRQPAGPVGTVEFDVEVTAEHPAGITSVRARVDGAGWVALGETTSQRTGGQSTWTGRLRLGSELVPAGGRTVPLDLQATSGDGSQHDRAVQITAVDANVPVVVSFTPTDGAKLPGTQVGATIPVVISTQDPGQGQLTSGIAAVEVKVDEGPWTAAQPSMTDGQVIGIAAVELKVNEGAWTAAQPSTTDGQVMWTTSVFVPGADDHTLTVRARDNAGQLSTAVTHSVVVITRVDLRDLSRQTYLADLIAFATQRLLTRKQEGTTLPPFVTPGLLAQALGQDVQAVTHMSVAAATAPVRTLRLVVEALARFMRPRAPAPVAAWPLRDGQGTVAADTASGLCDGVVEGATWVTGEDPPVLRFNPAANARVWVSPQASAQVRMRDRVTLVARIRPSGSTAGPGVIISKEGEYELARFPDGTIRWALATEKPGWMWIDSGAVAPVGQWTHVALAYDGVQVRTWTDGVLGPARQVSGPIGDVHVGLDELWIGGRPAAAEYFAGDIADVAVFDQAQTEYELHRLLGRSDDQDGARLWVDDDLPQGAQPVAQNDAWEWVTGEPRPTGGTRCHRSLTATGVHQHLFSTQKTAFLVDRGDVLVTDIWVDPSNPPRQVMLQWLDDDGLWDHRAYWGENLIGWGEDGKASRRAMGLLPAQGQWVTLRVPARLVGLEHRTVHGVAFTLFDGRAAWDRTGRVTGPAAAAADSGYLATAYRALIRAHGSSEVELRLARGATPEQRAALAVRLGISLSPSRPEAPDELATLLLDASELDASALARIFGFADPLGGAPQAPATPLLTQWRLAALRARWREVDRGDSAAVAQPPVIDPEVLVPGDVTDPASPAAKLLTERVEWRATQLRALRALRGRAPTDAAAVAAALGQVFSGVDLDALAASRRKGQDITAGLAAAGLTLQGLLRLRQLRDLAATGPLRDQEWEDLITELVDVLRVRSWPAWRDIERTNDVVVDPAVFRDSTGVDTTLLPAYINVVARQEWLDRLTARATSVASVRAAEAAAVASADQTCLPLLRDALIAELDPGIEGLAVADALTSALFVDVDAGPKDVTTRVEQAIEAVQGVVFAARTNRLVPQDPWPPAAAYSCWGLKVTDEYPLADFDEEWQWMGAYAAWQAAVSVFFRPELLLYPNLRPGATGSYGALLKALAEAGSDLTPQAARDEAAAYKTRLDSAQQATLKPILDVILTDQLTPADVARLGKVQPQLLVGHAALRDMPHWLLEVLWLVPLQLAVALSRAGQHLAAIDWLRTLYAYDQASAERIVFHGFRLEQTGAAGLTRPQNWLLGEELNPHRIADGRARAHLRFTLLLLARCLVEHADAEFTADTTESRPRARALYLAAARSLRAPEFDEPTGPDAPRVPPNPLLAVLRGRVWANLAKLRRGLTIAGVPRPSSGPEDGTVTTLVLPTADGSPLTPPQRPPLPTPYRYATLVARAQQLLASAAQVESSYLSALVGADAEGYTEQRASDDLELASARLEVQRSAAQIAEAEVKTARLQLARANDHANTLTGWITGGENSWEKDLLDSYRQIAEMRTLVAFADAAVSMFSAAASASATPAGAAGAFAVATAAGGRYLATGVLAQAEARSQEAAFHASYERRLQEWQLQHTLARDDAAIADQQVEVAKARSQLATQELTVAETAERHAQAAVNYLAGRRLTGEMYAWMAGELGEVYRYLLRQATSVAQLAEQQLAFERQQPPPATIKTNYWTKSGSGQGDTEPNRRGLTGSARLLRDLTELDQHAFETNRRKLNLEQVFSLSRTAPEAFAAFRRTGVLPFATPMDTFDRRFPGHFLRTIRRVRLSMVALVPPTHGIAANLTCSGQSRVVVGQLGTFQPIALTRPPDTVAYTSPVGSTGVFELDPQPELKYWFEDHGVDTTWELRLPRPANPIDYQAIADVLVTVEYTALHDADYARQVQSTLPQRTRGTLALSLRDRFPDAWYALVEPGPFEPAKVPPVTLPVDRADFPRNLEDIRLDAVSLLVVRSGPREEETAELAVNHLHLVRGNRRIQGGAATAVDDVISTRLGSGASWADLTDPPSHVAPPGGQPTPWDKSPTGVWELALSEDPDTREALHSGRVADLALVLSYRAELPPWPV
jgi:Tc toxin complex TcA C-terminal TcB-binding domain/Concanavalin A-like lectin/glucanases superfamily